MIGGVTGVSIRCLSSQFFPLLSMLAWVSKAMSMRYALRCTTMIRMKKSQSEIQLYQFLWRTSSSLARWSFFMYMYPVLVHGSCHCFTPCQQTYFLVVWRLCTV